MSESALTATWSPWLPPPIRQPAHVDDAAPDVAESEYDAAREAAEAEGRQRGLEAGRAEGYRRGFTDGQAAGRERWDQQCAAQARDMEALLRGVGKALAELDAVATDGMLDTTLAAARYLAMSALDTSPAKVRAVILQVLSTDPVWGDKAFLVVNPEDAAVLGDTVADQIVAAGLSIRPDPAIARGDCVITGMRGAVKVNREARWKSMLAHLRNSGNAHD